MFLHKSQRNTIPLKYSNSFHSHKRLNILVYSDSLGRGVTCIKQVPCAKHIAWCNEGRFYLTDLRVTFSNTAFQCLSLYSLINNSIETYLYLFTHRMCEYSMSEFYVGLWERERECVCVYVFVDIIHIAYIYLLHTNIYVYTRTYISCWTVN